MVYVVINLTSESVRTSSPTTTTTATAIAAIPCVLRKQKAEFAEMVALQ